jgi:hypothetical protein
LLVVTGPDEVRARLRCASVPPEKDDPFFARLSAIAVSHAEQSVGGPSRWAATRAAVFAGGATLLVSGGVAAAAFLFVHSGSQYDQPLIPGHPADLAPTSAGGADAVERAQDGRRTPDADRQRVGSHPGAGAGSRADGEHAAPAADAGGVTAPAAPHPRTPTGDPRVGDGSGPPKVRQDAHRQRDGDFPGRGPADIADHRGRGHAYGHWLGRWHHDALTDRPHPGLGHGAGHRHGHGPHSRGKDDD